MLIIDANQMGLFINSDLRIVELMNSIDRGEIKISIGGTKLREEYELNTHFADYIAELTRSGLVKISSDIDVDIEEKALVNVIESDDPHIIALAQIGGARLLCSDDKTLHKDFTNPRFIKPKGKVWFSSRPLKDTVKNSLIAWCSSLSK